MGLWTLPNEADLQTGDVLPEDFTVFTKRNFDAIASTNASSGSSLVAVEGTPSNYSAASDDIQAHLEGIDTEFAGITTFYASTDTAAGASQVGFDTTTYPSSGSDVQEVLESLLGAPAPGPSDSTQTSFTLGEAFSAGEAGYLGNVYTSEISQLAQNNNQLFDGSATSLKVGQTFTTVSAINIGRITVKLAKILSPTDNIVLKVYASDKTTLLGTSVVLDGSTLTTSATDYDFDFTNPVSLNSTTGYFIEVSRVDNDGTNYYRWYYADNTNPYSGGTEWYHTSGAWTERTLNDAYFNIYSPESVSFKTDASNSAKINFIGFATTTGALGDDIAFDTAGVSATQSGLTIGSTYYLEDTTGGTIATTPGTNSVIVGKAVAADSILIGDDNLSGGTLETVVKTSTRSGGAAGGIENIAHGMTGIPDMAIISTATYTDITNISHGSFDGVNNACSFVTQNIGSGVIIGANGNCIYFQNAGTGTGQRATMSLDETNIILSWTKSGSGMPSSMSYTITLYKVT